MLSEIKKNFVFFAGLPVVLFSAGAKKPKITLIVIASIGGVIAGGVFLFRVGSFITAITPVVFQKGLEISKEGTSAAAEFLREGTSTAGDYADFQKFCTLKNGQNTWKPRGNSVSIPGTSCSGLAPQGKDELKKLFPGAK